MIGFVLSLYICTAAGSANVPPSCAWNTHPQVYPTRAECQAVGEAQKDHPAEVIGEPASVVGHYRCKQVKY